MAKWYPLDVRGDKDKEQAYDALLDGVPDHLREFLTRWMKAALGDDFNRRPSLDRLLQVQHSLRATFDCSFGSNSALDSVLQLAVQKPGDFLSAIDYALQHWPIGAPPATAVAEVAKRLGTCRGTVHGLCERGELPQIRVSNAIRIAPADLAAYLERNRGGARGSNAGVTHAAKS